MCREKTAKSVPRRHEALWGNPILLFPVVSHYPECQDYSRNATKECHAKDAGQRSQGRCAREDKEIHRRQEGRDSSPDVDWRCTARPWAAPVGEDGGPSGVAGNGVSAPLREADAREESARGTRAIFRTAAYARMGAFEVSGAIVSDWFTHDM